MADEDIKAEIRFKLGRIDNAIRDLAACFAVFVMIFLIVSVVFYMKG